MIKLRSVNCLHEADGCRVWLNMQNGIIKLHPYCKICGVVKNVSSDRGKKIGYFVAVLSRLRKVLERRGYKISESQIRLILKELSEFDEFKDLWWVTFSGQREIFVSVVRKYVRVSEDIIRSCL